jgi:small subunit ribosomal protein S16
VAVKIKLKRMGKIRAPYYRIIIADSRTKRDGRAIEEIGKYHPKAEPSFIEVDSDRAQHWLSVGAQPTDPVRKILEITGDWQKFKGLPGADGSLRTAEPRADKKVAFAAAAAESLADSGAKAKPKGKAASGKADAPRGDTAKADSGKSDKAPASGKKAAAEPAAADAEPATADTATADTEAAAAADAAATAKAAAAARAEAAADETTAEEPSGDETAGGEG